MFRPGVGMIKMDLVVLDHKLGFKPIQPPRRLMPYNYRTPLSRHLSLMNGKGVIEGMDTN